MEHKEFIEKYKKGEIDYAIDPINTNSIIELGFLSGSYKVNHYFWGILAFLTMLTGIVFSFIVAWWIFIPGIIMGRIFWKAVRKTSTDEILRQVEKNEKLFIFLQENDLIHIKYLNK